MWQKLAAVLRKQGMNQEDLAGLLNVLPSRISKWKDVKDGPRIGELTRIAKAVGTKPAWLIDDDLPDDPDAAGLLPDEIAVLKAYRKVRGRISYDDVIFLIAQEEGRAIAAGRELPASRASPEPLTQPFLPAPTTAGEPIEPIGVQKRRRGRRA